MQHDEGVRVAAPVVSILMPVYNAERYLDDAIQSIFAQTLNDFELIVIDDASTDGSLNILNSYADIRLLVVQHKSNTGIVDALNNGLKEARGEYVARIDADDIAHPERLQIQLDYLNKHPQVGMVGSWIRGFGDVRREYIHRYPITDDHIKASLLFESPFAHPAVMIRRAALEKLDQYYSPDFPYVEDWELWTRLIRSAEASNIPMPLLKYRIHAKSVSQQFTRVQGESKLKLLKKIYSDAGLPFCEDFILGSPQSNMKWIISCLQYYKLILDSSKSSPRVNAKPLADVLQAQLILRTRQIAMFGIAPAWFIFRHGFVPTSIFQKLQTALKVLILTNVRAFITLLRTSEIYK
jgi:glycosyltransferase involved in cell wall biosynthesis